MGRCGTGGQTKTKLVTNSHPYNLSFTSKDVCVCVCVVDAIFLLYNVILSILYRNGSKIVLHIKLECLEIIKQSTFLMRVITK